MNLVALLIVAGLALFSAPPQTPSRSPELQALDVSVGRWIFHGTSRSRSGQPGTWTWNEDCAWSPNQIYLECTFSNVWSGRAVESLVVDTYNSTDHNYWHYEFYSSGENGQKPFAARMEIKGNTWTEYGSEAIPGKQRGERIIYDWQPPDKVAVRIETSVDGVTWTAVDQGTGIKQP